MGRKQLKAAYLASKQAPKGATCICPSCGTRFVKEAKQQAFCKSKTGTICKDHYWNNVTPTKRNNTSRISPAREQYLKERNMHTWDDDDPGWDSHKNY